jgi:dTDP-4-dehydrorhamnose reductase
MPNRILITGGRGQLGRELTRLLPDALVMDVDTLDITDFDAVQTVVKQNNISTIINCAAYTAVDLAEDEPDLADRINRLGPENLAKTGCKLIHISTDYVFNGRNCTPYQTDDPTDPVSVYGRTKADGEVAVLKYAPVAAVIRTAWLYSAGGNNFVTKMLSLGAERPELRVVADQIGSPTYAPDLAAAIVAIIPQLNESTRGIYHYTNEGVCSWYDFATEIMRAAELKCCVHPIPTSAFPTKATRPAYSVLDKTSIKTTFSITIPHWRQRLEACIAALKQN